MGFHLGENMNGFLMVLITAGRGVGEKTPGYHALHDRGIILIG